MDQPVPKQHAERIKQELLAAGVTKYGFLKNEARHLHEVIHIDEHIQGVAYGRYNVGSAMLVATDKRVLFFDKKPLFRTVDEITYDVISGINVSKQGPISNIVLHTRIGDYSLRYTNYSSAVKFRHYIEARRLEVPVLAAPHINTQDSQTSTSPSPLSEKEVEFLHANELATLSTIDRTGNVHGAIVYYYTPGDGSIYILSKTSTQKARNLMTHHQVALTIFNEPELKTLQLQAIADIVTDKQLQRLVFDNIVKPRQYGKDRRLPPVVQLKSSNFIVLRLTVTSSKFTAFKEQL